jgi:hypothetical protein
MNNRTTSALGASTTVTRHWGEARTRHLVEGVRAGCESGGLWRVGLIWTSLLALFGRAEL